MKKKLYVLLYVAAIYAALSVTGCKKKDKEKTEEEQKTELLTASPWRGVVLEMYINNSLQDTEDISDMTLTFHDDGTYVVTDSYGTENGTWEWKNDYTQIRFVSDSGDEFLFTVDELTSTSFVMYMEIPDNGDSYKFVYKFRR